MICSRPITAEDVVWGRCSTPCAWCSYMERWWKEEDEVGCEAPAFCAAASRRKGRQRMERTLEVGDVVVFVDELSRQHNALVTAIHGEISKVQWREDIDGMPGHWNGQIIEGRGAIRLSIPCINLVHLSANVNKQDPYGRQTEHTSSVVYKDDNTAHGYYFMFEGDEPNPVANTKS